MELIPNQYFHIYNRSNNNETVFREKENYRYFLQKYRLYFSEELDTIAYCLMPTHFHFLVFVKPPVALEQGMLKLKKNFGLMLSSYTKAINKKYDRHGSLFQLHTKTKLVSDENYLLTLVRYIHENPVRLQLSNNLEEWEHSSYRDYIGKVKSLFIKKDLIENYFATTNEFMRFSEEMLKADASAQVEDGF